MKHKSQLQQWKNTDSVITWFSKLQNKQQLHFIQFDVVDFYGSITPKLLNDALEHASRYVAISDDTKSTILQATNSFVYSVSQAWVKKQGGTFDTTMGGYHGAEVCDLVGLFILSKIAEVFPNIGFYQR